MGICVCEDNYKSNKEGTCIDSTNTTKVMEATITPVSATTKVNFFLISKSGLQAH